MTPNTNTERQRAEEIVNKHVRGAWREAFSGGSNVSRGYEGLVTDIDLAIRDAYDAGRKQGWLDIARRDKSGDGFADGVHAGTLIGQSAALSQPRASAGEEIGWVIERHINSELLYWTGRYIEPHGFSSDNADAIRFARKQDADVILGRLLDGNGKVAEHMWVGPPAHEWFDSGMLNGVLSCRKCGMVQKRDGTNKPCRGNVCVGPRATPSSESALSSPRQEVKP